MKPRKTIEIRSTLLQKGFRTEEGDHHWYWFFLGIKKTSVRTKVSHGLREYDASLLSQVKKQMKLVGKELDQFFDCDLSGDGYAKLLIQRGHVKAAPSDKPKA